MFREVVELDMVYLHRRLEAKGCSVQGSCSAGHGVPKVFREVVEMDVVYRVCLGRL